MKNPYAQTGRTGPFRYAPDGNHHEPVFGEIQMADAVVICRYQDTRYLLLIKRSDGHGLAVPGGHIDPGESEPMAAVRELAEETGLQLLEAKPVPHIVVKWDDLGRRHVPDPRETDDAWAVTTPITFRLGTLERLPPVRGGDDASAAVWVRASSYALLETELARNGDQVFEAHKSLLREVLDGSAEDPYRRIALEAELQEIAWDEVRDRVEQASPRHPLSITRWQESGAKRFSDSYQADEPLPDEDDDQLYLVRDDGERFEIEVDVTVVRRSRRPEPEPGAKDA